MSATYPQGQSYSRGSTTSPFLQYSILVRFVTISHILSPGPAVMSVRSFCDHSATTMLIFGVQDSTGRIDGLGVPS